MKSIFWIFFLAVITLNLCYANGGYVPQPPSTTHLIEDRIRNTPAVDPDVLGTDIRFYFTSFGLYEYTGVNKAPFPKDGELLRFGIENSDTSIIYHHVIRESMADPQFNEPNTISPNCYNTDDSNNIMDFWCNDLLYTDDLLRPEGYMRYNSGSGFWASPVFFKRDGEKTLIILTKSGCLMSLNVDQEISVVNWKIDLRASERPHPGSYKFEFMATPLVIGDKIYVAGIKRIHRIDDIFSTNPICDSNPCPGMDEDDYFEFSPVQGTNPDNSLYAVSRKGKAFKINWPLIDGITLGADYSSTPPFVDVDGHVYFTSMNDNDIVMSFVDQENRELNSYDPLPQNVTFNNTNEPFKSCILSDFSKNKYLFSDTGIVRVAEQYNYDSYTMGSDPISYPPEQDRWAFMYDVTPGATRFPGNNSILAYHNNTLQTLIYTIANNNSTGYFTDYLSYYPNYPTGSDLYNISSKSIKMSYLCYQNRYENNVYSIYNAPDYIVEHNHTWGGIAPYVSLTHYYNAIFGDETGCVTTYNNHIESQSVNFIPILETLEDITPEMGYSSFMQNQTNYPEKNEVESCEIYLFGCDFPEGDITYINSYPRQSQSIEFPEAGFSLLKTQIDDILPNKEYQVAFRDDYLSPDVVVYDNVEINQNTGRILLMCQQDVVINGVLSWDFTILNGMGFIPHYRNVTINMNAHLTLANSQVIIDNLYMRSGSHLTLENNANLSVDVMECKSPNVAAIVDLSGTRTGVLNVRRNFDNALDNNVPGSIIFKGKNLASPNYVITTFLNKHGCTVTFESYNQINTSDNPSVSIDDFQNKGIVNIHDCVSLEWNIVNYDPDQRGTININTDNQSFGNLIWNITDENVTLASPLVIGSNQLSDRQRARYTINNTRCKLIKHQGTTQSLYNVWGTVSILGSGILQVTGNCTLKFNGGSLLELNGGNNANTNGAQLLVDYDTDTGIGRVQFDSLGVDISGYKPSTNNYHGDRVVTDEFGSIIGVGQNPRRLVNLNITTTNPNMYRWDGIYINTDYPSVVPLILTKDDQSMVSGIHKFFVLNPGEQPLINSIEFFNCTYGVYTKVSPSDIQPNRTFQISGCNFRDCDYGIYLEDTTSGTIPQYISAQISGCDFGAVDAIAGYNSIGIALRRAHDVAINGCDFYRNSYGIMCVESSVLVGGSYNATGIPVNGAHCYFYNNDNSGIAFEQSDIQSLKSLVFENIFSGEMSSDLSYSGNGIWINSSVVDIVHNRVSTLSRHGILMNSYNWNSNPNYHGFATNEFKNNYGSELIGDSASLSSSRNGLNLFDDVSYTETGIIPDDPFEDVRSWDKYILAMQTGTFSTPADMRGNIFIQIPSENRSRFYPSYGSFKFDPLFPGTLGELIVQGINQFYQGLFDESIVTMKQAVEIYPDSTLTKLAIDYLYYATRASSEDYAALRTYLDLKIPIESLATYIKKEEIKTNCYIKEEDYLTAISRLQLIIDNPSTIADSIFALIDQAYCYMNLASQGNKALPNVSAMTPDFKSYVEFISGLQTILSNQSSTFVDIPSVPRLESNYPNPFNPETTIRFSVPNDGKVVITVYNIKGQKVKKLLNEYRPAGKHSIIWNGTDDNNNSVGSGLYFAKIEHGNKRHVHKMMLMK